MTLFPPLSFESSTAGFWYPLNDATATPVDCIHDARKEGIVEGLQAWAESRA